jgi:membrane protease YdiL (CAAX protease family)
MDYYNRFDDYGYGHDDYGRPLPELDPEYIKQQQDNEVFDFRYLLKIIAVSFFAIMIGKEFLKFAVQTVWFGLDLTFEFIQLQVISFDFFTQAVSPEGARVITANSMYSVNWLLSDIIVYTPYLVVFYFAFKKYMKRAPLQVDSYGFSTNVNSFPKYGVFTFFMAMYSIIWLGTIATEHIAAMFTNVFGAPPLRDVFGEWMPASQTQWLSMYFFVGLTGPIIEEVIFRHMLLKPLRRYGDWTAVVITSVLFGFFHGNFTQLIYTTLAGFIMGIAAVKANSVKPAIVIHIFNNSFDIAKSHAYELALNGQIPVSPHTVAGWYNMFLYAGLLVAISLLVMKHFSVDNHNAHIPAQERARMIVQNPWVIAMTVMLCIVVWRGS